MLSLARLVEVSLCVYCKNGHRAVKFIMANNERSRHLLPLTDSKECVEPNDTGIFNAIRQAESAASDPAITHCYAQYQANQANSSVADTGINGAGPDGNISPPTFWLAKEEKRDHATGTSAAPASAPKLTYLRNFQNARKSYMHTEHRLGCANPKTGHCIFCQKCLPQYDKKTSHACRNMFCTYSPIKCTILQYHTA
eukprot:1160218-Pelagomonas_calceolata.AAC.26